MTDPIIIDRRDLFEIVDRSIEAALSLRGLRSRNIEPEISQNKAEKLVGRKRLKTAMQNGTVRWRKEDDKRVLREGEKDLRRVWINFKDLQKLLAQPRIK